MGLRSFEHTHVETDVDQAEANEACIEGEDDVLQMGLQSYKHSQAENNADQVEADEARPTII